MDSYRHMMSFWGEDIVGGLVLLIIIGSIVYFLARNLGSSHAHDPSPHETPLEVLKKRYARGEITNEEFEKMRESLQDQDHAYECYADSGPAAGEDTCGSMRERKERHGSRFRGDVG